MNPQMLRRLVAAIMISALASCGGESDGNGPADMGTPVTAVPVTGTYRMEEGATSNDAALVKMNSLGQEGFAFVASLAVSTRGATRVGDLYVKDSARASARLKYRITAPASSTAATLALLNAQGAAGFAYKAFVGFSVLANSASLFVSDQSKSTTYAYESQPSGSPIAKSAFLDQLNAEGARGFRFFGPLISQSSLDAASNLYSKDSVSAATYSYNLVDGDFADGADMLRRLNSQGALGRVYRGSFSVDNAQTKVQVYEKRSLQSGAVEYHVEATASNESLQETLDKANAQGAHGFFYLGSFATADGGVYTVYLKNAFDSGTVVGGPVFP